MDNQTKAITFFRGLKRFGLFFIGLHTKTPPSTATFSNLVDDTASRTIDPSIVASAFTFLRVGP